MRNGGERAGFVPSVSGACPAFLGGAGRPPIGRYWPCGPWGSSLRAAKHHSTILPRTCAAPRRPGGLPARVDFRPGWPNTRAAGRPHKA
jgi:hypothetical protein